MSQHMLFVSNKIHIDENRDVQIKFKGSIKTRIDRKLNKKIIYGTPGGIYDESMFKSIKNKNKKIKNKKDYIHCYIKLNAKCPSLITKYDIFGYMAKYIKSMLEYNAFFYDGKIYTGEAAEKFPFLNFNYDLFFFGEEACIKYIEREIDKNNKKTKKKRDYKTLDEYKEWFKNNNTEYFLIPDLTLRKPKLIKNNSSIANPELNKFYENLFDVNEANSIGNSIEHIPPFCKYFSAKNIYKAKAEIEENLYNYLSVGKKSLIKKECISERLCGAIRGTITPDPFIKEDQIVVGTMFADSLYPEFIGLWKNADELNYLISRGVLKIPKDCFKYTSWMEENELKQEMRRSKNPELLEYYYPWWPKKYSFIPEEHLKKIKDEVNAKRMKFYNENQSDVRYMLVVDRNPTICQLSMYSAFPIFVGQDDNSTKISSFNRNSLKDKYEQILADDFIEDDSFNEYPEDTLRVHPLPCDGQNADFDGDVELLYALWTIDANKEALKLRASCNYISVDSGTIRNKIPKEMIFAMKNIYEANPELAKRISDIINS